MSARPRRTSYCLLRIPLSKSSPFTKTPPAISTLRCTCYLTCLYAGREIAKKAEASQRTAEGKPAVYCEVDEDEYVLPAIVSASSPALLNTKATATAVKASLPADKGQTGGRGVTTVHTLADRMDSKRQGRKEEARKNLVSQRTPTKDTEEGKERPRSSGGSPSSSAQAADTESEDDEILSRFKCGKIIARGLSAYVRCAVTKQPCSGQNKAGIPCVLKVKHCVQHEDVLVF